MQALHGTRFSVIFIMYSIYSVEFSAAHLYCTFFTVFRIIFYSLIAHRSHAQQIFVHFSFTSVRRLIIFSCELSMQNPFPIDQFYGNEISSFLLQLKFVLSNRMCKFSGVTIILLFRLHNIVSMVQFCSTIQICNAINDRKGALQCHPYFGVYVRRNYANCIVLQLPRETFICVYTRHTIQQIPYARVRKYTNRICGFFKTEANFLGVKVVAPVSTGFCKFCCFFFFLF